MTFEEAAGAERRLAAARALVSEWDEGMVVRDQLLVHQGRAYVVSGHALVVGEALVGTVLVGIDASRDMALFRKHSHPDADRQVTVAVLRSEGRTTLRVDDGGPGIAPTERSRVFDPFYRIAGTHAEGSGLGLAIVKEICDRHGLAIVLEDTPQGQGLRARVSWPRGHSDAPP